jgi:hypothetical protein
LQSAEQNASQSSSQRKPWQIPPRTDGRAYLLARKREAVEAKARELASDIGGFDSLPPFKRVLLLQAGTLLLEKRQADPVRVANALRQIYSALGLAVPRGRKLLRLPAR